MSKRRKCWVVVVLAAIVAALLGDRRVWFPGRAFDPVAWQDDARIEQGVRLAMADRMVARGTLVGKTRGEVVELLGEPPRTGHFAEWDLVYWLGPERNLFSIDSEWLVVRLDADGRVTDNRIVPDQGTW